MKLQFICVEPFNSSVWGHDVIDRKPPPDAEDKWVSQHNGQDYVSLNQRGNTRVKLWKNQMSSVEKPLSKCSECKKGGSEDFPSAHTNAQRFSCKWPVCDTSVTPVCDTCMRWSHSYSFRAPDPVSASKRTWSSWSGAYCIEKYFNKSKYCSENVIKVLKAEKCFLEYYYWCIHVEVARSIWLCLIG